MEKGELKSLLEALMFTATEPLNVDHFRTVIPDVDRNDLLEALEEMKAEYDARNAGIVLREVANGYQIYSHPRWIAQIQSLFSKPLIIKLSRSALETLAIVAYKQPITLPEVSEIRSCNTSGAIKTLLECNFIKVLGRKRVVGRPFLYGTTREFLVHFGMKDLSDMPQLQEFEELLGEKVSPDMLQSPPEMEMDLEPAAIVEPAAIEETADEPEASESENEIFEPPFEGEQD